MLHVLTWWLALQLFGLAALPIVARFFGRLPDRGVAFARPVGLLAVAYLLWMGNVVGVLGNTTATVVVLLVALGAAGWLGLPAAVAHLRAFWREHRRVAVVHELVFLGAFVIWAIVRAYQPDIMATEKPMEFGFLNSSMRSPVLPPNDPWLAGYSISYYYLGYVVIAIVARLAAVPPSVAFNLGIATLFALTVTGAFSLGYNLVRGGRGGDAGNGRAYVGGALTVLFVTFLANLEGFVEWLRLRNLVSGQFLAWLQIKDLTPLESDRLAQLQTWYPTDAFDNWWWFRASRVVGTYVGSQARDYTINEFPFFSFILGDMHPHVLTLPFAFVVLGFALNLLRTEQPIEARSLRDRPLDLLFIGFLFGSLSFLNAWDMLTYLFILAAAFAIHAYLSRPALDRRWLKQVAIFAGLALAASLVLYWPFYVTFRSQTQGIGIVGVTGARGLRTQLQHFVVFWGPLVFFAASYVVAQLARGNPRRVHLDPSCPWPADTSAPKPQPDWTRQPFTWILTGALGVALFVANAPALGVVVPLLIGSLATLWRGLLAEVAAGQPIRVPVLAGRSPLPQPGTGFRNGTEGEGSVRQGGPAEIAGGAGAMVVAREPLFVLVLIGTGALLLLGTELVFIRDFFNDRMNTVFKLYYQTWVLFAVAAAYAVVALADRIGRLHQAH
ncbi:MAG: hypothetical protein HYY04_13150, partial [Chloroflexi bacterium]|nr:hypothetical protein [Chloroflexota bacterium]